jgi:hypothetical protein
MTVRATIRADETCCFTVLADSGGSSARIITSWQDTPPVVT